MAVGFGVWEGSAVCCGMVVGIAAVVVGAAAGVGEGSLWHPTEVNAAIVRAVNTIRTRRGYAKLEPSLCPVWQMGNGISIIPLQG